MIEYCCQSLVLIECFQFIVHDVLLSTYVLPVFEESWATISPRHS